MGINKPQDFLMEEKVLTFLDSANTLIALTEEGVYKSHTSSSENSNSSNESTQLLFVPYSQITHVRVQESESISKTSLALEGLILSIGTFSGVLGLMLSNTELIFIGIIGFITGLVSLLYKISEESNSSSPDSDMSTINIYVNSEENEFNKISFTSKSGNENIQNFIQKLLTQI